VATSAWAPLLTRDQLQRVQSGLRERLIPQGAAVCHTGTPVLYWKGMIDGLVKLSVASPNGRTSTLTGMGAGAWFGEGPVLRSSTWDFDGVALRDTRIALIPRAAVLWLLEVNLAFSRYIIDQLNERLAQCLSVIEAERLEVAEVRVARCLAWLFNPVLYPGVGARLTLTQQEIGYLSGVSRQRVNRALQMMESAGLLSAAYGAVHVPDPPALLRFRA
jgi:CRP-like cAMP-binding protein